MGNAYRDDLAAAQARVADLERDHAALVAQNAALEAAAAPPPAPRRRKRWTEYMAVAIIGGTVAMICGGVIFGISSEDTGTAIGIVLCLAMSIVIGVPLGLVAVASSRASTRRTRLRDPDSDLP